MTITRHKKLVYQGLKYDGKKAKEENDIELRSKIIRFYIIQICSK